VCASVSCQGGIRRQLTGEGFYNTICAKCIDGHIIYIGVFLLLGALGAGRILGLDALVEKLPFVRRIRGAEYFLG